MRLLMLLAVCPFVSGCLIYGIPQLEHTPSIPAETMDVRAFRVLTTRKNGNGPELERCEVQELSRLDARFPSQWHSYLATSWVGLIPLGSGDHTQSLCVALYRPGYEIVWILPTSIGSKDSLANIAWKPLDAVAQEEQLQSITPIEKYWSPRAAFGGPPIGPVLTEPRSTTPELRAFLQAERERIASLQRE